ncbi:hypothetical protein GCM10011321_15280 [Youhaiella tibetensis]|nr:BA14K family protein [Youhaiella tibetensis]GGF24821.1 hypothetical protein GCM10011321_15280 [Youhaiella tibetensis]
MKRVIASLVTLAATASMSLMTVSPAAAQGYSQRYRYVETYCQRHPNDRDCYDFGRHGSRWDDRRYNQWYYSHYNGADAAIAGIFGLVAGAMINGALNSSPRYPASGHVQRCEARFKSYDPRSDTYLGYDGHRHTCNL